MYWTFRVLFVFAEIFLYYKLISTILRLGKGAALSAKNKDLISDARHFLLLICALNLLPSSPAPAEFFFIFIFGMLLYSFDVAKQYEGGFKRMLPVLFAAILLGCMTIAFRTDLNIGRNIKVDTVPYQETTYKYEIVSRNDDEIFVRDWENPEEYLKKIELRYLSKIKLDETTSRPYVYCTQSLYHQYDASGETPELLEKPKEKWSSYVVCGTREQLEFLLGDVIKISYEK